MGGEAEAAEEGDEEGEQEYGGQGEEGEEKKETRHEEDVRKKAEMRDSERRVEDWPKGRDCIASWGGRDKQKRD